MQRARRGALKVTLLGSGTSTGVPVPGCSCAVCTSTDPRNRRCRTSALIERGGRTIVIDTPADFRYQALRRRLERVDAVLYTHAHADHIFGIDDLRSFSFRRREAIPCYGSAATVARLRHTFAYIFEDDDHPGGGKPRIELEEIDGPFELFGERVVPIPVLHGRMTVFGYRFGRFAYVTDCSEIPSPSFERLAGVEALVLGALRYRPHPTHFTIDQACAAAERIGARRVWLTHLNHEVDHTALERPLPEGIELAYDGLTFEVD